MKKTEILMAVIAYAAALLQTFMALILFFYIPSSTSGWLSFAMMLVGSKLLCGVCAFTGYKALLFAISVFGVNIEEGGEQ